MKTRTYRAPLRSIPYLARETFNELGTTVFTSVIVILLILFYISGEVKQPPWIGISVKLTAVLIIVIDVIVRSLSFKIEIDSTTLSYYCRGIFNLKRSKFLLSDISNVDSDKKLHYRLLSLTAIDFYGVGSSDSLIGKVVLTHDDAQNIRESLSFTQKDENTQDSSKKNNVKTPHKWIFLSVISTSVPSSLPPGSSPSKGVAISRKGASA